MRYATGAEVLELLRDRSAELLALINEPEAILSAPIDGWSRILATISHPPVQEELMLYITINETTVRVPVQLTDGHDPVQCGPWLQRQQELAKLAEDIRANDVAMCLAVEIRRRQSLERLVIDLDDQIAKLKAMPHLKRSSKSSPESGPGS